MENRLIQRELQTVGSSLNLHIQFTKDEVGRLVERMRDLEKSQTEISQTVAEYGKDLDHSMSNMFSKYESRLEQRFQEMEKSIKDRSDQEEVQRKAVEEKLQQYDGLLESLDKKWETKSNDRYIASIIQKNLFNNQQFCAFLVEQTVAATEERYQRKIELVQKQLDERIQQQFYQFQNFQTFVRKQERTVEEVMAALNLQKDAVVEFQRQQNKRQNQMQTANASFKESVSQQLNRQLALFNSVQESNQEIKRSHQELQGQIHEFTEAQKKQTALIYSKINDVESSFKNKLSDEQARLSAGLQQQLDIFKDQLEQSKHHFEDKLRDFDHALKKIAKHDSPGKNVNRLQQQNQPQQLQNRSVPKQRAGMLQKPLTLKEQMQIIEELFFNVQSIFQHLRLKLLQRSQDNTQVSPDSSPKQTMKDLLAKEAPDVDVEKQHKSQQDQTKQYQLQVESQQKSQPIQPFLLQGAAPQIQIIHPVRSMVDQQVDHFNDSRLYNDTAQKPLYVVGKHQVLDIRPSVELQALQTKIKQVVSSIADEQFRRTMLDPQTSARPNSAKRKLPKINSRSLHFSLDE